MHLEEKEKMVNRMDIHAALITALPKTINTYMWYGKRISSSGISLRKKTFSILKQRYSNKIYPSGFDPY